jgi:rifampicin phosphotransferase
MEWEPPGPGQWSMLSDHFVGSLTPAYRAVFRDTFTGGLRTTYARYGVPVDHIDVKWVNGHLYLRPVGLVATTRTRPPPTPVVWLLCRLHPAFRRRTAAARAALAERPWRGETRRWYEEQRSAWESRNRALQAEVPESLSDEALGAHLHRAVANWRDGYRLHFELHGPDLVPLGLLLARGEDWGLARAEVLDALRGSSPASTGGSPALAELRALVTASGERPSSLDDVRAIGPGAAALLERYLDDLGWRMTSSYDLDGRALVELPSLVLASITTADEADPSDSGDATPLRARVPEPDRAEFDRLLDDARLTYGLRDDNSMLTAAWPVGLVRRALLEAGRRLATRGALHDADHVFELLVDEVTDLLGGRSGLSASEAAHRAEERRLESAAPAPRTLGPDEPLPPFGALPRPLRLLGRALLAARDGLLTQPGSQPLAGTGVGHAAYRGRARVAHHPEEAIERLEPGDVLVTPTTTPAFNAVLAIAGALVVEEGGLVSHAAITARELGLPAVVGVPGALAAISDGDEVEVDPVAGRVRVVAAAGARPGDG